MVSAFLPDQGRAKVENFLYENNSTITVKVDKKDPAGEKSNDGFIHIKVEGGQAPYSISVFSTAVTTQKIKGAEVKLKDLGPGTYMFIIQDQSKTIVKEVVELSVRK